MSAETPTPKPVPGRAAVERPLRVLMVEASAPDAELCLAELRRGGFAPTADVVDNTEAFVRCLERSSYDVVLADYALPGWSGVDALALLRRRASFLPFILVTGTVGEETAVDCIKQGASDYVLKDRPARLPFAVERALREKALRKERTDAYEALRSSEREYRTLFESANVAILIFEPDDEVILEANQEASETYGIPRAKLRGMSLKSLTRDVARGEQAIGELLRNGSQRNFETTHYRADGTPLHMLINASLIEYRGRKAVLSLNRDTTQQKQADEEIRRLVGELRERVKELTAMQRIAQILGDDGKPAGELLSEVVSVLPAGWQYPEIAAARIVVEGAEYRTAGFRDTEWNQSAGFSSSDGTSGFVQVAYLEARPAAWEGPFLQEERSLLQRVADMLKSYLERSKAQGSLRASEGRYRDLLENANDIIETQDLDGNLTSINHTAELITGYSREEVIGRNVTELIAPEFREETRGNLSKTIAGASVPVYQVDLLAKDGHRVALEVSQRLITRDGRPLGVQAIARDVTERKKLEEQLNQAQKMEAAGRLAGGVAHDFNNLLTIIAGYGQLLQEQLDGQDPRQKAVREIRKAAERAATLTRQLLAFSRRQMLQPRVLDLNAVVTGTEGLLRPLIGENIELVTVLPAGLGRVKADPGQIEQVIVNLAINARDAMPNGGRVAFETANAELDESYLRRHGGGTPGRYVMLAVSDTGRGMDNRTRARIFEPFFTTKRAGKGTGLGLATVYGIVKQSGGLICVYSEPGQGSVFKVYLPCCDNELEVPPRKEEQVEPARGDETILLVEDDAVVRTLIHDVLGKQGYTVLEARNGALALQLARVYEGPIHLLVTDVVMPRMGGRQLSERMATIRPDTRVLYISGYTGDAAVHRGIMQAGTPLLQKPFSAASLLLKVREVLGEAARTPTGGEGEKVQS